MLKKWLLTIFSMVVLACGGRAEEPSQQTPEGEAIPFVQWVELPEAAKVKAAYLGIGAEKIDEVLRAQLKLPAGMGMAVNYVAKDGPADLAGVRVHDILYKLDDQLIVNTPQLVTLLRMHKPGDSVELTVIREAQQTKLTAKLVEGAVPPLEVFSARYMGLGAGNAARFILKGVGGLSCGVGSGAPASNQATIFLTSSYSFTDDDYRFNVTSANGTSHLVVKDKAGKVLYDGVVDPNAKEIPESVRKKIQAIPKLIGEDDELIKPENKPTGESAPPAKTDGF